MLKTAMHKTLSGLLTVAMVFGFCGAGIVTPSTAGASTSSASTQAAVPKTHPGQVGSRGSIYDDPANGIYVSPTGNDATATGSIDKPYKNINAALAAAGAGGTVILRGGTYTQAPATEVRFRNPNVTLKSAKGEWAIINLPFPTNIKDPSDGNSAIRFDPSSSGSKLQAVEVTGGYYAVCFNTKWDWGEPDKSGASNIIIEDCILHDSRYEVVKLKPLCNNITIRYCEIYNPARAETDTPNWLNGEAHGEAIDNVNAHNMVVQNNYMHDLNIGLYAKGGATDVLIENNRIENALGAGIVVAFDTSPNFFDLDVNPGYYECIRTIVRNNLIINTGWEGIGFYASKDAEVYNNTVVSASTIGPKYNCPIYFGISTQDWDNPAGCPANINPKFHHNVVSQPSYAKSQMISIRFIKDFPFYSHPPGDLSGLAGMPIMYDNCYYIDGKHSLFTDNRPTSPLTNGGLATWKTHIGGDNGSVEVDPALDANYMTTNPQCVGMGIQFALTTPKNDISKVSIGKQAWTGKQIKPTKVIFKGKTYNIKDISSETAYGANKNIGLATVTMTGKGEFEGSKKTVKFTIVPKKQAIKRITVGSKKMTVKWTKAKAAQKVTGYQLRYRLKDTSSWKKPITIKSKSTVSRIIKGLKKGKKYDVQLRAYKTVKIARENVKLYGSWSPTKTGGKIK